MLAMTDLADGSEGRNYAITRCTENVADHLCIIFVIAAVAGVFFFYLWTRVQIINIGYESQRLQSTEDSLRRTERNLALEEQTLKNPERIDAIARNELGMLPLRPDQVIPAGLHVEEPGTAVALAMANRSRPSSEPGKPSASN
jgi:cell division protein FtsL